MELGSARYEATRSDHHPQLTRHPTATSAAGAAGGPGLVMPAHRLDALVVVSGRLDESSAPATRHRPGHAPPPQLRRVLLATRPAATDACSDRGLATYRLLRPPTESCI